MSEKLTDPSGDPPFEESLRELEELTEKMESSQLALSDLLKNYERGTHLLGLCEKALEVARKKIELMHLPEIADNLAELEDDGPKSKPANSQDVRLF